MMTFSGRRERVGKLAESDFVERTRTCPWVWSADKSVVCWLKLVKLLQLRGWLAGW